jgi:hypothetical protein
VTFITYRDPAFRQVARDAVCRPPRKNQLAGAVKNPRA